MNQNLKLGDICRFEYGTNLPSRDRIPGPVPVYGSNGVVGSHSGAITKGTTIIIGRKGSIGEIHLSNKACWPIDTTYYIDKTCTTCDLFWLAHQLRHLNLDSLNKASGVPGLSREDAYKLNIILPEIEQQRRIATRLKAQLTAVEDARSATQAQLDDSRRLIPAILKAAFAEIADADMVKIGSVAKTSSGSTPARDNLEYWKPAKFPWVKTGEVAFEPILNTAEKVSFKALQECSLPLLPKGTVLLAMYGQGKTRGQSAVLEIEASTNQACFAIFPNDTFDSEYLQFWLRHSYEDLRAISDARGGNQSNLNGNMLNQFEVPVLPSKRQLVIVKHIQAAIAEAQILQNTIQKRLTEIQCLPSHLLAQAFQA